MSFQLPVPRLDTPTKSKAAEPKDAPSLKKRRAELMALAQKVRRARKGSPWISDSDDELTTMPRLCPVCKAPMTPGSSTRCRLCAARGDVQPDLRAMHASLNSELSRGEEPAVPADDSEDMLASDSDGESSTILFENSDDAESTRVATTSLSDEPKAIQRTTSRRPVPSPPAVVIDLTAPDDDDNNNNNNNDLPEKLDKAFGDAADALDRYIEVLEQLYKVEPTTRVEGMIRATLSNGHRFSQDHHDLVAKLKDPRCISCQRFGSYCCPTCKEAVGRAEERHNGI